MGLSIASNLTRPGEGLSPCGPSPNASFRTIPISQAGASHLPPAFSPPRPQANKIQYYEESETYCGLTQDQKTKAEKFLGHIEYKDGVFLCHPIPGYNVRTRTLARDKELGFICSCQGFKTKERKYRAGEGEKPYCSHIGALKLWFVERNRKLGYGPFKQTKIEG